MKTNQVEIELKLQQTLQYDANDAGPSGLALMGIAAILTRLQYHWPDMATDVAKFHVKMALGYWGPPRELPMKLEAERTHYLFEELREYLNATDCEQKADALLDLICFALGTLQLMGFNTHEGWRRVMAANMLKEPAPGTAKRVRKPEGWQHPSLADLVWSKPTPQPPPTPDDPELQEEVEEEKPHDKEMLDTNNKLGEEVPDVVESVLEVQQETANQRLQRLSEEAGSEAPGTSI